MGEDTIEGQRVQQRVQSQIQVSDRFSRVKGLLSVDGGSLRGHGRSEVLRLSERKTRDTGLGERGTVH